jgi:chromosome segregation ATPase
MKRRRRGQPVADPLPAAAALGLAKRVASLAEEVRAATAGMYRARESRDKYKARVRSLEAAVAAERRRSAAVVAEQAAKTAALREEVITLRRQLADVKERPSDRPATADAAAVGKLRARLADGNAAYAKLTATQEQLRTAFDQAVSQRKATAHVYRSWDRLCLKLYQSTKGQPLTEIDQQTLQQWIAWRNEQHQKKAGQK